MLSFAFFIIGLTILHLNQYTLVSDDIWFSEKSISEPDPHQVAYR